jgi:hypothetical protein
VLVDEAFEGHRECFYPTRAPLLIQARDDRQVDAATARVAGAEISYVRLREKLFGSTFSPTTGFDQIIAHAQQTLDLLPNLALLLIVPMNRRIYVGEIEIALRPVELILYAQFSLARVRQAERGDGFLSLDELDGMRDELLQRYDHERMWYVQNPWKALAQEERKRVRCILPPPATTPPCRNYNGCWAIPRQKDVSFYGPWRLWWRAIATGITFVTRMQSPSQGVL